MKIKDVLNANFGTPVDVIGTLTKVYDRKAGQGRGGPYSFQNAVLEDETGKVNISFYGWADQSQYEGKTVSIVSGSTKPATGAFMQSKEDKKTGKTYTSLQVKNTATMVLAGQEHGVAQPEVFTPPQVQEEPADAQSSELLVKHNLRKLANLDLRCFMTACYVSAKCSELGYEMTPEEFQARWSSYFITTTRDNMHKLMPHQEYVWSDTEKKYFERHFLGGIDQEPEKPVEQPKIPAPVPTPRPSVAQPKLPPHTPISPADDDVPF